MDIEKDYYSILGVSPTADIIVIKAAYKALVKVFHPDKYTGSAEDAHNKTVQLNEAFEVLSNTSTRKKYDDERANNTYKEQATEDSKQQESVKESLKADWDLACKYKPKLSEIYKNLDKLSVKLSFSFQVLILESKQFDNASAIAKDMEITYLDNYFGPNKTIMEFAKKLLFDGYLAAAKDLNRVVKVLGNSAEASVIISQIESDYSLYSQNEAANQAKSRQIKREQKREERREEQRKKERKVEESLRRVEWTQINRRKVRVEQQRKLSTQEMDLQIIESIKAKKQREEYIEEKRRREQYVDKAKRVLWISFFIASLFFVIWAIVY
jgi:curved DNA-binding protein CbpA